MKQLNEAWNLTLTSDKCF